VSERVIETVNKLDVIVWDERSKHYKNRKQFEESRLSLLIPTTVLMKVSKEKKWLCHDRARPNNDTV